MNKNKLYTAFLIAVALVTGSCLQASTHTVDSLLQVYQGELEHANVYIVRHQGRIDSLRALRPMIPEVQLAIAREYLHFQSDSARAWYIRLQETHNESVRTQAFIELIQLLSTAGYYANAFALMDAPDRPSISNPEGYRRAWVLYSEAASTALMPNAGVEQWEKLAGQYYDSLLIALEKDTVNPTESRLWLGIYRASDAQDWNTALDLSRQLISLATPDEQQYAILAKKHAILYEKAGDADRRLEWLIRSAITDVRCGITDNGSSRLIAKDCYERGNLALANIINDYTLTNASYYNAPTRFVQTYAMGHAINNEYERLLHRYSLNLTVALSSLAILLLILALTTFYIFVQYRELHTLNARLQATNIQLKAANHIKEQYICRYLEVYSDYIRRLTSMARRAGEKNPSAFMDREMQAFYHSFDDTFLSLYGNFVSQFNALLKPEARLTPKSGELMTIEMRIFALILLGIDSSTKIAELLCYSHKTISNYRTKIKNNALGNRDDFERQIRSMATIY
ncbi:MAG: hypothetical protein IJ814_04400 [Paludibacteraceae bacterium]|nr:hypothetical protein [Paludibacteraceae bacterium]